MVRKSYKAQPVNEPESPGKFLISVGGLIGFCGTFLMSLFVGHMSWTTSLLVASLSCFFCAFAMKRIAVYLEKNIDLIRKQKYAEERARRKRAQEEEERREQMEDELLDSEYAQSESVAKIEG